MLVKLADRPITCGPSITWRRRSRSAIAQETLDIYAPLAHRLGISWIKSELEDRRFDTCGPRARQMSGRSNRQTQVEREKYIEDGHRDPEPRHGPIGVKAQRHRAHKHSTDLPEDEDEGLPSRSPRYRGVPYPRELGGGMLRGAGLVHSSRNRCRGVSRIHRAAQAQHVPVAAYHRDRSRGQRSRFKFAPMRCIGWRKKESPPIGPIRGKAAIGQSARTTRSSPGCVAHGVAEGPQGPQGVPRDGQGRPFHRRGLRLHSQGRGADLPRGASPVDFAYRSTASRQSLIERG